MKKLINLLSSGIVLLSSPIISNIAQASNIKLLEKDTVLKRAVMLNVPLIRQQSNFACVPASIQSIFGYFELNLDQYTQYRIFEDLRRLDPDPDPSDSGIWVEQYVADYMNRVINQEQPGDEMHFRYNDLGSHFGTSVEEMMLFQNYVFRSLNLNHPLLFIYQTNTANWPHAVALVGVEIDEHNPWATSYTFMDPSNGEMRSLTGFALSNSLSRYGAIVGYGNIHDRIDEDEVQVSIANQEVGKDHLAGYDVHKAAEISVDVTATTGSKTTGSFRNSFNQVALDEFNGEIYNFTWRKPVTKFSLNTAKIPDDNDNWKGALIEIDRSNQKVGQSYIEGILSAQLRFSRSSLDHLILHLVIYVAGASWNTGNWAHIWFMSGTILSFNTKK